jgi:3-hydroxyacyl-[acyl-carrier-protein] dehydratase
MAKTAPDPVILERVKSIVRRDLKLGASAPIADDMPFFNSEADLDSLDILLLVTSIEKEFSFKIPSQEVGKEVFENPSTLARYIQQRSESGAAQAGGGQSGQSGPDLGAHLARLPHGDSFRFVTRLIALEPGRSAQGVWELTGREPFLAGHFPGRPLVPGVLIAESMAQVAGLAGARPQAHGEAAEQGALAHMDVRFEQPVTPPASIAIHASLVRELSAIQQFEVSARLGQIVVAQGTLALHRPRLQASADRQTAGA